MVATCNFTTRGQQILHAAPINVTFIKHQSHVFLDTGHTTISCVGEHAWYFHSHILVDLSQYLSYSWARNYSKICLFDQVQVQIFTWTRSNTQYYFDCFTFLIVLGTTRVPHWPLNVWLFTELFMDSPILFGIFFNLWLLWKFLLLHAVFLTFVFNVFTRIALEKTTQWHPQATVTFCNWILTTMWNAAQNIFAVLKSLLFRFFLAMLQPCFG